MKEKATSDKICLIMRISLHVMLVMLAISFVFQTFSSTSEKKVREEAITIKQNNSTGESGIKVKTEGQLPIVYFTSDISSKGLIAVYKSLGKSLKGKVAVKLHSGEPGKKRLYILSPDLIKDLVTMVNGTIVECNTGLGARSEASKHKQVMKDHGYAAL